MLLKNEKYYKIKELDVRRKMNVVFVNLYEYLTLEDANNETNGVKYYKHPKGLPIAGKNNFPFELLDEGQDPMPLCYDAVKIKDSFFEDAIDV